MKGKLIMRNRVIFATTFIAALVACSSSNNNGNNDAGHSDAGSYIITISGGFTFSPANLVVPPGATVTVNNTDSMLHSATSESAPSAFTPGAVGGVSFD